MGNFYATFKAHLLWRLGPLIEASEAEPYCIGRKINGLTIHAHPDGGVVLAATDGRTLAVVRDPAGRIAGADGLRVSLPPGFIERARPHGGMSVSYPGATLVFPAPEWMQPDTVDVFSLFAGITGMMPHPSSVGDIDGYYLDTTNSNSGEYSVDADGGLSVAAIDKVLRVDFADGVRRARFSPSRLMPLARFEVGDCYDGGLRVFCTRDEVGHRLFVSSPAFPEFAGAVAGFWASASDHSDPIRPNWIAGFASAEGGAS